MKFWLILPLLFINSVSAQKISSINFEGLTKTKESYLLRLVECSVGDSLDSKTFEDDIQYLRNLNLFFNVEGTTKTIDSVNYDVTFKINEAKYLYPIFYISGFRNQLKLQAGFNQINFLGKNQSFGGYYQYYDRHSFSIFNTAPRHGNKLTGHEFAISKISTLEPLYFEDTTSMYNYDNFSGSAGIFFWLGRYLKTGLGGMYLYEKYVAQDSAFYDMESSFDFHKYQIRTNLELNKVNQHYEFRDGIYNNFYLETIQTVGVPMASFWKSVNTFRYYKRMGKRGNLALRGGLGIATNNFSPFAPFVLDGFINVRGVGNRVARGTAELIANVEYRYSIMRKKLFFLQGVIFADYGTLRPAGEGFKDMFTTESQKIYLGLGARLHSRWLYNTSFRLDYAFNLTNFTQSGLSFGVGQFF